MAVVKERILKEAWVPKWVLSEHISRYEFGTQFIKDKIVVDCACGDGLGSNIFMKAGSRKVVAIDIDSEIIKKHQCDVQDISFVVADACSLPLSDNFADIYISFETIEHIKDDKKYLLEAVRVLKPEDIFICSTPNRIITNPGKDINFKPFNKFHVREYSKKEFLNLLKPHFKTIELYGQNPQSRLRTKIVEVFGKFLPYYGAIRINQALKIPRFILDASVKHAVETIKSNKEYEYLVAVCR